METVTSVASEAAVLRMAKFVDVNGISTRYYELGDGEPMVLCHGGEWPQADCANTWSRNLGGLAQTFHVYTADKLGMGMTDNPKSDDEYTIEAVVEHMYQFIRAMGLETVHMVGQSRGGYLATRLTLEHPEMVRTLVCVDSSTLAPEVGDYAERRRKTLGGGPTDPRGSIRFLYERMSYTQDHITDDFIDAGVAIDGQPKMKALKEKLTAELQARWLESLLTQKEETLRWIEGGRLVVPTLVYWGANDPTAILPQGQALFDLIREHAPRAHMHVVNHAGHFHYREYPEEWNRVVTNFILSTPQ